MRICMWSGPRNLSTAMMRSFESRADMAVIDEPFFAPFLKVTGTEHPGREETLKRHETDPSKVAAMCALQPAQGHVFQKHMPHHMRGGFPLDWCQNAKHFFLIREPARVIASYVKGRADFTLDDLGFGPQRQLWEKLGRPPVIDSADILREPEPALGALCAAIDLPWDAAMLSWASGPRETDGAWAPYWYTSVEASTGFGAAQGPLPDVSSKYKDILDACQAEYAALRKVAI